MARKNVSCEAKYANDSQTQFRPEFALNSFFGKPSHSLSVALATQSKGTISLMRYVVLPKGVMPVHDTV